MSTSSIEWTATQNPDGTTTPGKSWNPIRARRKDTGKVGWHCERVSEECDKCYSDMFNARNLPNGGTALPFVRKSRDLVDIFLDETMLAAPLKWKKPAKVFVCSMTDLFADFVTDEMRDRMFAVMALCPHLTFQVLTKRPERMREYCSDPATPFRIARGMDGIEVQQVISKTPFQIRPMPGNDKYFVSNIGEVFTLHGSGHCVWCGSGFTHGQQDSIYCGAKCRHASGYARGQGRDPEPAGRIMRRVTFDIGEQGHRRVRIIGGDRELVHRLVLRTFVREPIGEEQACHRNGDPSQNHVCNLRWGSQSDNWDDRIRHGNFKSYSKISEHDAEEIRRRGLLGESAESLGPKFGISGTQARNIVNGLQWNAAASIRWPLPNLWAGVSCGTQRWADTRIPLLLQTPAAVRFVSYEPALGPIDFTQIKCIGAGFMDALTGRLHDTDACVDGLDWIIVGGESGPGARPFDASWARSVVQQCKAAGVPCFVKQFGAVPMEHPSMIREWPAESQRRFKALNVDDSNVKMVLQNRKGGSMEEWPSELRVREFPK